MRSAFEMEMRLQRGSRASGEALAPPNAVALFNGGFAVLQWRWRGNRHWSNWDGVDIVDGITPKTSSKEWNPDDPTTWGPGKVRHVESRSEKTAEAILKLSEEQRERFKVPLPSNYSLPSDYLEKLEDFDRIPISRECAADWLKDLMFYKELHSDEFKSKATKYIDELETALGHQYND